MHCTNCGVPLPQDASVCPNCGKPTSAYYANSGSSPYNPTVMSQSSYGTEPASPYNPPYQQPPTSYGADPYNASPGYTNQNPYNPYNPYGTSPVAPPAPTYAPPPILPPQASSRRSQNRVWLTVGIGVLIGLLIVGGIFALLLHIGATSTTQISTPQAGRTPTANTTTNPYGGGGTLVLDDPLQDNSKGYKWDEATINSDYGLDNCGFTNGAYHLTITQVKTTNGSSLVCNPEAKELVFSNLAFEVKVSIVQGDYAGVAFRADQASGYYTFAADINGNYFLDSYTNNKAKTIRSGSNAAIIKGRNQTNLIAIVAKGQTISMYANGQFLDSVQDSTYSQGQIGIYGGGTGAFDIAATSARVWQL